MTEVDSTGLLFTDRQDWQRWQDSRQPIFRRIKQASNPRRRPSANLWLSEWGPKGTDRIMVALDSITPSQLAALIAPAQRLAVEHAIAVLSPMNAAAELNEMWPEGSSRLFDDVEELEAQVILSAGDHLRVGGLTHEWAKDQGIPYVVVQHGVLTPFSPPLPPQVHLLAWTDQDRCYWTGDASSTPGATVGSQLIWLAQRDHISGASQSTTDGVTFLGQLHGVELPRKLTRGSVHRLLDSGLRVTYRPHPSETDLLSRLQHEAWRRKGLTVSRHGHLAQQTSPVVAHFSTGLLEAAASGIPSYAFCVEPPGWLEALWQRYGIARWGTNATTRLHQPTIEPARSIANYVRNLLGEESTHVD